MQKWLAGVSILATIFASACGTAGAALKSQPSNEAVNNTDGPAAPQSLGYHRKNGSNLKDPRWVADPENYEVTKTKQYNYHIQVPILEYHESNYTPGNSITLKPGQFQSELKWLHDHQFHTINLGQLYAAFYYGYKLPSRPVVITFDDGYESNYLKAFPLLKQYGYQATIFMISSYAHVKPDRTVKYPKLTISELKTLQASGIVDIESHTMDHINLAKVSDATAMHQLTGSAAQLQPIVGHPIRFFCYPYGGYAERTIPLVRNAGYLLATTTRTGYARLSQGPLQLDRIGVYSSDTLKTFANKLSPSLLEPPGSQTTNAIVSEAATAFYAHHYQQAIDLANKAIRIDQNNAPAYNIRGIATCYASLSTSNFTAGLADIEHAIHLSPSYGYAWFNKALCLERFAHYDEALQTYQHALPLTDTHWRVWSYYGMASIYGRRGDVQHTVFYLKQAIALDPDVKKNARTEPDFNPVRQAKAFQAAIS